MADIDQAELAAAPEASLGGRKLKILPVVARQNRRVTPLILDRLDVFVRAKVAADAGEAFGLKISSEDYDAFLEVVQLGALRALPDLTIETMLEWPIKTFDLIAAVMVVAKQAGLLPEKVADPLEPSLPVSDQPAAAPAQTSA